MVQLGWPGSVGMWDGNYIPESIKKQIGKNSSLDFGLLPGTVMRYWLVESGASE